MNCFYNIIYNIKFFFKKNKNHYPYYLRERTSIGLSKSKYPY